MFRKFIAPVVSGIALVLSLGVAATAEHFEDGSGRIAGVTYCTPGELCAEN